MNAQAYILKGTFLVFSGPTARCRAGSGGASGDLPGARQLRGGGRLSARQERRDRPRDRLREGKRGRGIVGQADSFPACSEEPVERARKGIFPFGMVSPLPMRQKAGVFEKALSDGRPVVIFYRTGVWRDRGEEDQPITFTAKAAFPLWKRSARIPARARSSTSPGKGHAEERLSSHFDSTFSRTPSFP